MRFGVSQYNPRSRPLKEDSNSRKTVLNTLTVFWHSWTCKRLPLLLLTTACLALFAPNFYLYLKDSLEYRRSFYQLSVFMNESSSKQVSRNVPNRLNRENITNEQSTVNITKKQSTLWKERGCESKTPLLLCNRSLGAAKHTVYNDISRSIALANQTVFSNSNVLVERARSCALVGSSGRLLSQRHADDIDGHDVVIRLNDAPIYPYENYVGRRMPDVAIINLAVSRKGKCLQNVNPKTLLVQCHHPGGISTIGRFCATHGPVYAFSRHLISTVNDILSKYVLKHRLKGLRSPTAGMYAVIFSLHLCKELDIYGFGAGKGELYSYYRDLLTPSTQHYFDLEEEFLKDISHNLTTPVDVSWMGCNRVSFHP
ncbi:CMP-N-acetylneuraminate-beta-galactosamide-alpha-2,3-sialyltransferase 1-like [Corticium candelabrum]|uniref:CMP-N-acetylneuraminate-beta-galactosamide- alpha-2,3-sialyltransferase 1-like n=1 Tax=Corticium candelabrum TaxID=121492 RepID=UPI002E275EE5|nr:CMP-N-acetylneuraminate-beta-galactosamide-alpha-2,3-sialyltransferase 1-like [Corticium candelabrum]XP_062501556.1 CMP-N-acetylneuraminate-beta-galactosamide-alpha-2,3-sialyltransferase 1-like [Corticium candelabrum]